MSPLHVKSIFQIAFRFGLALLLLLAATSTRADSEPFAESAVFLVNTSTPRLDSDGDGMPDDYELDVCLNPLFNDANVDPDGDGLTNIQEYNAGSNPVAPDSPQLSQGASAVYAVSTRIIVIDTDGDGMPDDREIALGLDPARNDANEDPDGDGLTNLQEYNGGTSPLSNDSPAASARVSALFTVNTAIYAFSLSADSYGDGMPDWWEQKYGLNALVNDASGDTDGDGVSNFNEYNSGSNPVAQDHPYVIGFSGIFLVDTGGRSFDSDGDGLPDWWEKLYFNDPRAADLSADTDGMDIPMTPSSWRAAILSMRILFSESRTVLSPTRPTRRP